MLSRLPPARRLPLRCIVRPLSSSATRLARLSWHARRHWQLTKQPEPAILSRLVPDRDFSGGHPLLRTAILWHGRREDMQLLMAVHTVVALWIRRCTAAQRGLKSRGEALCSDSNDAKSRKQWEDVPPTRAYLHKDHDDLICSFLCVADGGPS